MTLVDTAGHLHPGGLYTDLKVTRGARTKELFRSVAKYFEPAGAVSWDVSMTHTKPSWRVAVKAGDRLNVSATYDTRRASWYESMGIMVLFVADGKQPGAKNPFTSKLPKEGLLTHGHLRENRHHGGGPRPSSRMPGRCRAERSARTWTSRASSTSAATSTCRASAAGRRWCARASRSTSRTSTR